MAAVARELGVNEGTGGNWVARAREARDRCDEPGANPGYEELKRLRAENAELRTGVVVPPAWDDPWSGGSRRRRTVGVARSRRGPEDQARRCHIRWFGTRVGGPDAETGLFTGAGTTPGPGRRCSPV